MSKEIIINRSKEEIEDGIIDLIDEYINTEFDGEIGEDGEEFDLDYTNGDHAYLITISIERVDNN